MFRILCDPSSGNTELCLTGITGNGSPQVQNYAAKHRPSTRQNICESLRVIPVSRALYSLMMDHITSETCRSGF
jgi:hypothetical protein